jgi:E3 ubiquitin-protein ligase RBBP6
MSCVRFKFKSALEYDKVTFDGLQISVADLREKIMTLKKMNSTDNYTLNIMDAQTRKVYEDDKTMISRNSTVIVMRVPKLPQNKFNKTNYRMQETNFLQVI